MRFRKITENVENIQTLPDKPQLSATDMKIEFDKGSKIIKEAFNDQVDDLNTFQNDLSDIYFRIPQRNIVVGDNLDSQMLHFDFSNLTFDEMSSSQYIVYVDNNHYIQAIAKSSSLAGINLKDGATEVELFRINNQDVITTNVTEYKLSNTFASVTSIDTNTAEYEKITINDNNWISDIGDKNYVHTQSTSADTWVITHNLGKYPSVTVFDSAGDEVIGDINYNSLNQITITFAGAFKGTATLN